VLDANSFRRTLHYDPYRPLAQALADPGFDLLCILVVLTLAWGYIGVSFQNVGLVLALLLLRAPLFAYRAKEVAIGDLGSLQPLANSLLYPERNCDRADVALVD